MKHGFTVVEVIIVVIVISILTGIGVAGFSAVRNQAADSEAKSMVAQLASALERYYQKNNEYPVAEELISNPLANYTAASSVLGMSASALATSSVQFTPCSVNMGSTAPASACSYGYYHAMADTNQVKYITKHLSNDTAERSYIVQSPSGTSTNYADYCEFRFRSDVPSKSTYVMTYFSREENKVKYIKSPHGESDFYSAEGGQCVFTAL